MSWLWNDSKDGDEDGAARDEDGAKDHVPSEHVAEEKARKESVPEERDGAQRRKDDDR